MGLESITAKFKLNQKVKDDAFSVDSIPDYTLNLQIGSNSFRFCVIDDAQRKCLWLEDFSFTSLFFSEQLLDQLNLIYDDHQVLQAGFWKKINLSFKNQHFTLIPETLFKMQSAAQYLKYSIEPPSEPEQNLFYIHKNYGIANVFSADKQTLEWFRAIYLNKQIQLLHYSSALIEGTLSQNKEVAAKQVIISVEQSYLTIIVSQQQQLLFCNTFYYMSVQDFSYYVMLVIGELNLDPETCKVILYGELSHDSAIFSHLYRYIRNITFGTKPSSINFNYKFDEVLDHRYFDVYSIHLCE
ncbi:DUF3822 family protein [Rhodocytophaga rosea]|uniref:DUF3822 family protein n=1 Tax=Rhodocytophaga rosea TaxID=2704465 RepID=A0A6C0GMN3_9BACT|nr:DUF3822 family protein [Rhodocytophaga rosea]QHT69197.1 DUF3822 family protein [Rhodocytophaga rosea]